MPFIKQTFKANNLFPKFNDTKVQLIWGLALSFPAFPFMLIDLLTITLTTNLIMNAFTNSPHVVATNTKFVNLNVILTTTCVTLPQLFYKIRLYIFKCPLPNFDVRMFNFEFQEESNLQEYHGKLIVANWIIKRNFWDSSNRIQVPCEFLTPSNRQ